MSMPTPRGGRAGALVGRGDSPPRRQYRRWRSSIYCTRPCDEHPQYQHADGYVFRAKTYLADAVAGPLAGYRLSFDRMQSYVVESRDEFKSPDADRGGGIPPARASATTISC